MSAKGETKTGDGLPPHELIAIVADLDAENAIQALLARDRAIGIRPIRNPRVQRSIGAHDAGCYKAAHHLARQFADRAEYLIVLFDRHGSGAKDKSASDIEQEVQERLDTAGWRDRSAVVVFDPELEAWLWTGSPHTARTLGWPSLDELHHWLHDPLRVARNSHIVPAGSPVWPPEQKKPADPKEAYLLSLKRMRLSRSAVHFEEIANKASFKGCRDEAFGRFLEILRCWFSA